jgi:mono/diheme cytochrome c family protein
LDIIKHFFQLYKSKDQFKFVLPALILSIGFLFPSGALAQEDAAVQAGKKLFNANCAACHKLNKRAVGPALQGVSAKYDREWLYSWIKNSTAMVKSGDAQAVAI